MTSRQRAGLVAACLWTAGVTAIAVATKHVFVLALVGLLVLVLLPLRRR